MKMESCNYMSKTYKYIVQPGQNLVDVAMQEYGSINALLQLCIDNGFELGQEVPAGTELIMYESNVVDKRLVAYYKSKNHKVASGSNAESFWILANGFWDDIKIWIDEEKWRDK